MSSLLPQSADVVIIGGGIMGASIAWHLARRKAGTVVLIERSTIASGASGKTGALLRQHYSNRPEAKLAHDSLHVFRNWHEIVGIGDCEFVESGLVFTLGKSGDDQRNLDYLRRNVDLQNEIGIKSEIVSPEELLEIQPFLDVSDLIAATWEPESGYVNAVAATRSMALAAQHAGAEVLDCRPAFSVIIDRDRVVGVQTAQGAISTGAVVCACGPWTKSLLSPLGVALPISALRVQVAVLNRPLAFEPAHAAYIDAALGMFLRPWAPGQTMVGISGGDQHDEVDPNNFELRNSPGYGQAAIATISKRMPIMAGASYSHGHACLYDMTPDAHPIIGQAGPDGLYVVAGFSGAGFKKSPAVGQTVAELICEGKSRTLDLSPFALSRFETDNWRKPWSETEYLLSSDFGHKF